LKRCIFIGLLLMVTLVSAAEKKKETKPQENAENSVAQEVVKPDQEKMISKQIERNLRGGEAVWLPDGNQTFLGIYTPNRWKETQGAVLLLHDVGANADWPNLISPFRRFFPEKGWHTLSLQSPMVRVDMEKEAYLTQFDRLIARIDAGVRFLKQKNIGNIILVGHGWGAAAAILFITRNQDAPVTAFVALSIPGGEALNPVVTKGKALEKVEMKKKEKASKKEPEEENPVKQKQMPERDFLVEIQKIKIPLFDIIGLNDYQEVVREAEKRKERMQLSENQAYRQWRVEGADHYFRGQELILFKRILGWLRKNAGGMEIATPSGS